MTVVAPAAATNPARQSVERVPWPTVQITAWAGERVPLSATEPWITSLAEMFDTPDLIVSMTSGSSDIPVRPDLPRQQASRPCRDEECRRMGTRPPQGP